MGRRSPPKAIRKSGGITLKILLGHMQNMERVLREEIRQVRKELATGLQSVRNELRTEADRADRRHALVMTGLQNIDDRLDDLEVHRIPAIEAKVGR